MLPFPFEVRRPGTLAEAMNFLKDADEQIQVIAGGTDLIPRLKKGLHPPKTILDLSLLKPELSYIRLEGNNLCIGALTTHDEVCRSELVKETVPVLAQACRVVGCQQIRNRGTLGGNIANASPAGDTLPPLLTLDSGVKLVSSRGIRAMPLEEFFLAPGKTRLERDEIISEVYIPASSLKSRGTFKKLGIRNALTISVASVAVTIDPEGKWRIAYGALAPRPVRARELERAINEERVREWGELQEFVHTVVQPISDVRASADYRREMAVNLTYMSLFELNLVK